MAETDESLHFLDYWRVISSRKEIVMAVSLLVVVTGIAITYAMPSVFVAGTLVAVEEGSSPDVDVFNREGYRFDPLRLRTQFEIIQSRPIIEDVIRKLSLDEKLGAAYGYADRPDRFETTWRILSKSMRVQQHRDTNLILIQIYLSEPKGEAHRLVADVANEVAESYKDNRMQVNQKRIEAALRGLFENYEGQQKRVRDAETKLEEIRQKYKLDIVDSGGRGAVPLDKMTLAQLEGQRLTVRLELTDLESRLNKIKGLQPDQLLQAVPYLVGDAALAALVEQKRAAETQLAQMRESYGPKHPEVQSKDAMLTKLAKQIEEALNGLRTGIQAKYDAARAKFEILETELNALKARERLAEASGYKEFDDARQEVAHARHVRDVLEMRHLQEQIEMRIPRTIIEVIERAVPANEKSPVSPNFLLNVVLSIVLGIGCGIGLAYFVEYMDTSVKTIEDVERSLGVAVLGVIPRGVKPLVSEGPQSSHAEAYRVLRTNIQFSKRMVTGKALTCTSGSVGEGKSLTIFNLAYVSAQLGERVLIVDSDLHRPRQHKILGVSNKVGLTNVLIGEADLDEVIQRTPQPNLDLLPSGRMSSGTHGLLDTSKMREVITTLRERYDRIYFDAPPIIGVSDATLLAREMDGVLLVVQHRKYPRAISLRAKSMLEHTGANLLGVVLNNINISRDYSYYYYHYTSHYHRKDAEEAKEAKA